MSFEDTTQVGLDLYSEADSIFGAAFALETQDAELLVDLGEALSEISGKERAFELALALAPPSKLAARARIGLGWYYHFFNEYRAAILEFEEAVRLDPPNPPGVYAIGWMYVRLKQFPQARAVHRQLLGLDREYATQLLKDINKALNPEP
jgi:tetratricopeptide (TPR) repeat protein